MAQIKSIDSIFLICLGLIAVCGVTALSGAKRHAVDQEIAQHAQQASLVLANLQYR
jgi:cbb3-type cytochrome oxidase subunit 3